MELQAALATHGYRQNPTARVISVDHQLLATGLPIGQPTPALASTGRVRNGMVRIMPHAALMPATNHVTMLFILTFILTVVDLILDTRASSPAPDKLHDPADPSMSQNITLG